MYDLRWAVDRVASRGYSVGWIPPFYLLQQWVARFKSAQNTSVRDLTPLQRETLFGAIFFQVSIGRDLGALKGLKVVK